MVVLFRKALTFCFLSTVFVLVNLLHTNAQNYYWQQKVDTRIDVTLDDSTHILRGSIEMDYYNNSPDTLHFIYFHLYPNAYKNDRTAFARQMIENGDTKHYFSKEIERGYIDSLQFYVNNKRSYLKPSNEIDVVQLILNEALLPGEKIKIFTPFKVKIPLTFSRLGHYEQSYQISQWFPKPAVYDKNGWNAFPYLDLGEFYSEYGSYEVRITLPENYIVMATGNMQEEKEIAWLDSISNQSITNVNTISNYIPSSQKLKTVTFKEDNIHDFAWFADKYWTVRKKEIIVPETNKKITGYTAFYPQHSKAWEESVNDLEIAIQTYSELVGPYPYNTVKVVEGALSAGGGMEYPTITVIDYLNDRETVNTIIVHEVGHNWFYGILGNNERKFPWMDESINSYYEKIALAKYKNLQKTNETIALKDKVSNEDFVYNIYAASRQLQSINLSSEKFKEINYGVDIYYKGAKYFQWLAAYMGVDVFNKAMQDYFVTWQYKHPQPEDFRTIMEKHAKTDLSWFFDVAMNSDEPIDFAIKTVKKDNDKLSVTIKNKTSLRIPAIISIISFDSTIEDKKITTLPFTGTTTLVIDNYSNNAQICIDKNVPDFNPKNNTVSRKVNWKPFLGFGAQNSNKITNWVSPAVAYNYYDGIMIGLLFHNITLPENKFSYAITPMYSISTKELGGTGFLSFMQYPKNKNLHYIEWRLEGKKFSYKASDLNINNKLAVGYSKVAPEVIFSWNNKEYRTPITRTLSVKAYWINETSMQFERDALDSLYRPKKGTNENKFYTRLQYKYNHSRTFNPFGYTLEAQAGEEFVKIGATFNLRVDYNEPNKALYFRTYAGKFFYLNKNLTQANRYMLTTTHTGENDYFYDDTYIGRLQNNGFLSQQTAIREGGFVSRTSLYANRLGLSDNWLLALNVKTDIPYIKLPIPLRIFANVATFSMANKYNPSGASILFESGIETTLLKYLTISVPIIVGQDFSDYNKSIYSKNKFLQTISFTLHLSEINWRKAMLQ